MKKTILITIFFYLGINISALADFDDASFELEANLVKPFEAWCKKRKNECEIIFTNNGISINKKEPVEYSRLIDLKYEENHGLGCNLSHVGGPFICPGRQYTFDILYRRNNNEEGVARIIFAKYKAAKKFQEILYKIKDPSWTSKLPVYNPYQTLSETSTKNIKKGKTILNPPEYKDVILE